MCVVAARGTLLQTMPSHTAGRTLMLTALLLFMPFIQSNGTSSHNQCMRVCNREGGGEGVQVCV